MPRTRPTDPTRRPSLRRVAVALVATTLAVVSGGAAVAGIGSFEDVPAASIFHDDIEWLAANGITNGCNPPTNDEFCPNDVVTRSTMAAFMRRLAESGAVTTGGAAELVGGEFATQADLDATNDYVLNMRESQEQLWAISPRHVLRIGNDGTLIAARSKGVAQPTTSYDPVGERYIVDIPGDFTVSSYAVTCTAIGLTHRSFTISQSAGNMIVRVTDQNGDAAQSQMSCTLTDMED